MKIHIYVTHDGLINWIEDMPIYTHSLPLIPSNQIKYEKAYKQAISQSIPFEDQSVIRDIALSNGISRTQGIYAIILNHDDVHNVMIKEDDKFRHVARIVPKEIENQDQVIMDMFSVYAGKWHYANPDEKETIINHFKRHFEIKRNHV
jgi:hypothetical protein